jgi:hypothetical protein
MLECARPPIRATHLAVLASYTHRQYANRLDVPSRPHGQLLVHHHSGQQQFPGSWLSLYEIETNHLFAHDDAAKFQTVARHIGASLQYGFFGEVLTA